MQNKDIAHQILGYIPAGYILVVEEMNNGAKYRTGMVYVDGKPICGFRMELV